MKTYVVKTYHLNGTYLETINPNSILNELSFSNQLMWWQGQLKIDTDYPISNNLYHGWELVKVWLFDDFHKNGKQIYLWFVSQIQKRMDESREYITLICLWSASLLKYINYTNGNYSQTCYNMMVNILTFFRNYYTAVSQWSIANTVTTTQNWTWNYNNCFDCFNTIANAIWYKWIVDGEWKLHMFLPSTRTNHKVKLWQDVYSMTITSSVEPLVNYYQLARNGGTVQTYQDTTSQSTYWMKMKYESNSNLNSSQTQNDYWNAYIWHYKVPRDTYQIILNGLYPYEDILPWDTVSVLNTDLSLNDLVINKIQYKTDQAVLTIDYEDTLWSVIK